MSRTKARELAFILTFDKQITGNTCDDVVKNAADSRDVEPDVYTVAVFRGVFGRLSEIDAAISSHLKGWKLERLSKVVLALSRICIYEMKWVDDVDTDVAVSEAVRLCKIYATDEDAAYLNGVLGSIAREAENE